MDQESWRFSRHLEESLREERTEILVEWIYATIRHPDYQVEVSEVEVRYWKQIEEFGNRYLRVVDNPQTKVVITAFFDRSFRP